MKQLSLELSDEEMEILEREAGYQNQSVEEFLRAWVRDFDGQSEGENDFRVTTGEVINDTAASNPGLLRTEWTRFFRAYPRIPIGFGIVIAALAALVIFKSLWWMLLLVPVVWLLQRILLRIQAQFRAGDTNPGIIISQQPPLIAVLTDLTMGAGSFPVIKILPQPLRACGLSQAVPGTRVATVSLYSASPNNEPHWSDFDPVVVQAATKQTEIHQNRLASISTTEWHQLETALLSLPRRTPGVYPLGWQPKPGALLDPALGGNESKQG